MFLANFGSFLESDLFCCEVSSCSVSSVPPSDPERKVPAQWGALPGWSGRPTVSGHLWPSHPPAPLTPTWSLSPSENLGEIKIGSSAQKGVAFRVLYSFPSAYIRARVFFGVKLLRGGRPDLCFSLGSVGAAVPLLSGTSSGDGCHVTCSWLCLLGEARPGALPPRALPFQVAALGFRKQAEPGGGLEGSMGPPPGSALCSEGDAPGTSGFRPVRSLFSLGQGVFHK